MNRIEHVVVSIVCMVSLVACDRGASDPEPEEVPAEASSEAPKPERTPPPVKEPEAKAEPKPEVGEKDYSEGDIKLGLAYERAKKGAKGADVPMATRRVIAWQLGKDASLMAFAKALKMSEGGIRQDYMKVKISATILDVPVPPPSKYDDLAGAAFYSFNEVGKRISPVLKKQDPALSALFELSLKMQVIAYFGDHDTRVVFANLARKKSASAGLDVRFFAPVIDVVEKKGDRSAFMDASDVVFERIKAHLFERASAK